MIKDRRIYTEESMYHIGQGNYELCTFDFSLIPVKMFSPFFNTLPNILYKKVKRVKFTCDGMYKETHSKNMANIKKEATSLSIMQNKPNFIAYLTKIIEEVLPKTKSLQSLYFSNINFTDDQIKKLFKVISVNKKLESISFMHIHINDEDVSELLKHITPYQFFEVQFADCGLTSASFKAIKAFILQNPRTMQINRRLQNFNVDKCNFSNEEIEEIEDLINEIDNDNTTIDPTYSEINSSEEVAERNIRKEGLRGRITSTYSTIATTTTGDEEFLEKMAEKVTLPKHHILSRPCLFDNESVSSKRSSNNRSLTQEELDVIDAIEDMQSADDFSNDEIRKQNEYLKKILHKMSQEMHISQYSDDVFIVGKGSEELVEVVKKLKNEISKIV